MPEFRYKAYDRHGKTLHGQQSALSSAQVVAELNRQQLIPVDIVALSAEEGRQASSPAVAGFNIKLKDQTAFTRDLAALLKSGMDLDRALKLLAEMAEKGVVGQLALLCRQQVKEGKTLSQALEGFEQQFGVFYINVLKAAEASGKLPDVLESLATHMEQRKALRSSVQSALIYPCVLVIFGVLSMLVMMTFVIPQFESLFTEMGDALPLATRILLAISDTLTRWWWALLIMGVLGILLIHRWFSTPAGRHWWQRRVLRFPVLGKLIRTYQVSHFTRTLATLLANGVSLVKSLGIATDTVTYRDIHAPLAELPSAVKQGKRISTTLEQSSEFSPMLVQMIRMGEETGNLPDALHRLSDIYDENVRTDIQRAMTLFEPLLILALGAMVALMIIAMLLGILSVNEIAM